MSEANETPSTTPQTSAVIVHADSELTREEIEEFQTTLQTRERELTGRPLSPSQDTLLSNLPDETDQAVHMSEAHLTHQLSKMALGELREVRAALVRINVTGNFGICVSCEEGLSFKRLSARPHARMCMLCAEKKERESGAPRLFQRRASVERRALAQ